MQEGVVTVRIKPEQPPIEQHINCLFSGVFDHEFGARLAKDCRRLVDELERVGLDPQIEAAFWIGLGRVRRGSVGRRGMAF